MYQGVPVLAASTGALPELVGAAAWTADPYDVDSLVAALRRLEQSAAGRSERIAMGRRIAATLAAEAVDALHGVYRRLGLPLRNANVPPLPSMERGHQQNDPRLRR